MILAARGSDRRSALVMSALGAAASVLVAGASCVPVATNVRIPAQAAEFVADEYDDRLWAIVVRENVSDGLVNYTHLATHREPLDAYLNMVAGIGPTRTPECSDSTGTPL